MSDSGLIEASLRTDQGRVRGRNEDFIARWEPENPTDEAQHGRLYIVADGVGGAEAGDLASSYATDRTIHHYLANHAEHHAGERLLGAMRAANSDLRQLVASRGEGTRMATTMVAALIKGAQLYLANVGDSRGYHWRDGVMVQMTRDQSLVAQLVEEGAITAEEAVLHPHRNVILYSLGSERSPRIDLFGLTLQTGDRLLLCSDGLTRYVTDEELAAILSEGDPDTVTAALVDLANERGGADNISVAVLQIGDLPAGGINISQAADPQIVATNSSRPRGSTAAGRTVLWIYTAFLCLLETILILLVWYQLRV